MKDDKFRTFDPSPGEVWSSTPFDRSDQTIYYFVEKLPPTIASARFGSSSHTWRVIVLETGFLEKIMPSTFAGTCVSRQFDAVKTGYGPFGAEHDEGWDSYDNCYQRLA